LAPGGQIDLIRVKRSKLPAGQAFFVDRAFALAQGFAPHGLA
jgi:hypothetical protein